MSGPNTDYDPVEVTPLHAEEVERTRDEALTAFTEAADLAALQRVIDSRIVEPEATYSLLALGLAFGKVFIGTQANYDWWMVEDEYGRDPAIRYKQTTLLLFPKTMISKRVEDGEQVDVVEIFEGLKETVRDVLAEHYPDA